MIARITLTLLNLTIEHVLIMAKDYVMVMLNYCFPNAHDFTFALFSTFSNTHKDHERFLVNR